MTFFVDIASQDEDTRIEMIGYTAMVHHRIVGFVVEKEAGKGGRYIKKLQKRFPGIRIIERFDGPVSGCETIKVGPSIQ